MNTWKTQKSWKTIYWIFPIWDFHLIFTCIFNLILKLISSSIWVSSVLSNLVFSMIFHLIFRTSLNLIFNFISKRVFSLIFKLISPVILCVLSYNWRSREKPILAAVYSHYWSFSCVFFSCWHLPHTARVPILITIPTVKHRRRKTPSCHVSCVMCHARAQNQGPKGCWNGPVWTSAPGFPVHLVVLFHDSRILRAGVFPVD